MKYVLALLAFLLFVTPVYAEGNPFELPDIQGSEWSQIVGDNLVGYESCAHQPSFKSDWKVDITFPQAPVDKTFVKSEIVIAGQVSITVAIENQNSFQRTIDVNANAQLSVRAGDIHNLQNPQLLRFDLQAFDGTNDFAGVSGDRKSVTVNLQKTIDSSADSLTVDAFDVTSISGTSNMLIDVDADQSATVCKRLWEKPTGQIGDLIWLDGDYDGVQDSNEPGAVAKLTIIDADGRPVKSTISNEQGKYIFTDLMPGRYCVMVDEGPSYLATKPNVGDDNTDSDLENLNLGCVNVNQDQHLHLDGGYSPVTNLTIEKTMPDTVITGGLVTATITVNNVGTYTATGVIVRDVFPSGLTLVGGYTAFTQTKHSAVWVLSDIAPKKSQAIIAIFQSDSGIRNGSSLENMVSVESDTWEYTGSDNDAYADTSFISNEVNCYLPIIKKPGVSAPLPENPCDSAYLVFQMQYPLTVTNGIPSGMVTRTVTVTLNSHIAAIPHPSWFTGYNFTVTYHGPGAEQVRWYRYGDVENYERHQGATYTWVTKPDLAALIRSLYLETDCGYMLIVFAVDPLKNK